MSMCVCVGGIGAVGTAQQHRNSVLGSSPFVLPSPRSHSLRPPPMLFWNLGSCVKVAGLGFRDAVRAGSGTGALAGFNPSRWAAVPGALGSKGPRNGTSHPSSQPGGAPGPDDISTFGPGPGLGLGLGLGRGQGRGHGQEVCHCQGTPCPGQGQSLGAPFPWALLGPPSGNLRLEPEPATVLRLSGGLENIQGGSLPGDLDPTRQESGFYGF